MKFTFFLAGIAVLTSLTGCRSLQISSETDRTYEFSRIRTYQWVDAPADVIIPEEAYTDQPLQQALNNELAARGWKEELDAEAATIQVAYGINLTSHVEYMDTKPDRDREFSGGLVFNRDDRTWNFEEQNPDQIEYIIETGSLHLIITDTATGKRIWHGKVETEIDRSLDPDERDERYREIARRLFEKLSADIR